MLAWLKVIALGLVKLPCKLLAPIAVLFVDRQSHPVWGVKDATDLSWYNTGIRNGAHNLFTRPQADFVSRSNTDDHTLEQLDGFQWRVRKSLDGKAAQEQGQKRVLRWLDAQRSTIYAPDVFPT